MSKYEASSKLMILPYGFISILISWYIYGVWQNPMQGFILTMFILIVIIISAFIPYKYDCSYFNVLANERENEDIGSFARSLDYRTIDTWAIRAVYEELNDEIYCNENNLPIRASDRLDEDLDLDDDDLFYLYNQIAQRTNRTDEKIEQNPYYGKVDTVEDMVLFFNAQPKAI